MNIIKIFILIIFINFIRTPYAQASCVAIDKNEVTITVKQCRIIKPDEDAEIKKAKNAAKWLTDEYYREKYTGALITNEKGWRYFYKSDDANACKAFPEGQSVTKKINSDCCDTGAWGNCVFGGNFITDF